MFVGRLVYFRAFEFEDLDLVRSWNFDPVIRESFNFSFPVSRVQQQKWFERLLADKTKQKLIIVDKETDQSIGLMSIMRIDHVNRNCEIGWTIGNREFWGKGHSIDAAYTFLKVLFDQLNMHMVYGYVLESNTKALHFDISKIGFVESGRYKQSIFRDGRYWDNIVVCLFKEALAEKMKAHGYDWD